MDEGPSQHLDDEREMKILERVTRHLTDLEALLVSLKHVRRQNALRARVEEAERVGREVAARVDMSSLPASIACQCQLRCGHLLEVIRGPALGEERSHVVLGLSIGRDIVWLGSSGVRQMRELLRTDVRERDVRTGPGGEKEEEKA